MYNHRPVVSFCTTCHNRVMQLKETFDSNLRVVSRSHDIEWVILNYCSSDDLHDFMTARLPQLPRQVVYVRLEASRPWHICVAKNLAHRYASGEVLANLDCDNLIGDAAHILRRQYWQGRKFMHLWSGVYRDGTCGRLALERSLFYALGGYDERFYPMGYDDRDLIARANAMGVRYFHFPCPAGTAVFNTKNESISNCGPDAVFEDYDRANQAASVRNIEAGLLKTKSSEDWLPLDLPVQFGALQSNML